MAAAAKRLVLALVVCWLAALAPLACESRSLRSHLRPHFVVEGNVFCDTCQAGFETRATTYIADAKLRVECRDRLTAILTYTADGVTDSEGKYRIKVDGEHDNEICESVLVSSPESVCAAPLTGRDRARVVLSHADGVVSNKRIANNLGFRRVAAMEGCHEIMREYQLANEDSY